MKQGRKIGNVDGRNLEYPENASLTVTFEQRP